MSRSNLYFGQLLCLLKNECGPSNSGGRETSRRLCGGKPALGDGGLDSDHGNKD